MSNPKHDQFAGGGGDNEIDEMAITGHHELSDGPRLLLPAELRKLCGDIKRFFKIAARTRAAASGSRSSR
jgi:hypothetical protein